MDNTPSVTRYIDEGDSESSTNRGYESSASDISDVARRKDRHGPTRRPIEDGGQAGKDPVLAEILDNPSVDVRWIEQLNDGEAKRLYHSVI